MIGKNLERVKGLIPGGKHDRSHKIYGAWFSLRKTATAILFFLCQHFTLQGQDIGSRQNDPCVPKAFLNAKHLYSGAVKGQTGLYNGRQYNFRYLDIRGIPFFGDGTWQTVDINYNGQLYESVPMKFDLYNQLLVTDYYDIRGNFYFLQLQNERIDYFDWPGHHFVHIRKDSAINSNFQPGFYDILYDGKVRVLARYTKSIVKNNIPADHKLEAFSEKDYFFIEKDGKYYPVKKKRSLLDVFNDRQNEIKTYIKKNRFKFNTRPGPEIAAVAAFYDKINE